MRVKLEEFEYYLKRFKYVLYVDHSTRINENLKRLLPSLNKKNTETASALFSNSLSHSPVAILLEKFLQGEKLFHNGQFFLEPSDFTKELYSRGIVRPMLKRENYRVISLEEANNIFAQGLKYKLYKLMNMMWSALIEDEEGKKEDRPFHAYYVTDALDQLTTLLKKSYTDLTEEETVFKNGIKTKLDDSLMARAPYFIHLWKDYPVIKKLYMDKFPEEAQDAYHRKLYDSLLKLARTNSAPIMKTVLEEHAVQSTLRNISAYFREDEILRSIETILAKHRDLRESALDFLKYIEKASFDKAYDLIAKTIEKKKAIQSTLKKSAEKALAKDIKVLETKLALCDQVRIYGIDTETVLAKIENQSEKIEIEEPKSRSRQPRLNHSIKEKPDSLEQSSKGNSKRKSSYPMQNELLQKRPQRQPVGAEPITQNQSQSMDQEVSLNNANSWFLIDQETCLQILAAQAFLQEMSVRRVGVKLDSLLPASKNLPLSGFCFFPPKNQQSGTHIPNPMPLFQKQSK